MSLPAEAVKALAGWTPPDEEQRALRDLFLGYLGAHADGVSRACRPGHITASAAVLDPPRRRVLLTLHRKIGRWLQLGGHCEPGDATLAAAALREATEESALAGLALSDGLVRLDLHAVPCGPGAPPSTAPPSTAPPVPGRVIEKLIHNGFAGAAQGRPRQEPAEPSGPAGPAPAAERPGLAGPADLAGPAVALGPAGPAGWAWHLDVQFVAISPPGARHTISDESDDLRWWPVDALPSSADAAVRRLVARACLLSRPPR